MARIQTICPLGGVLYSVTVSRALAPMAYRQALRLAAKAKGALVSVTFC